MLDRDTRVVKWERSSLDNSPGPEVALAQQGAPNALALIKNSRLNKAMLNLNFNDGLVKNLVVIFYLKPNLPFARH